MPAATLPQNRTISFGLPAALLLHAIALALLFLLPRPAPLEQPPENSIEVEFVAAFPSIVSLDDLRAEKSLADMQVLKKGQRLSVQPVTEKEFKKVCQLGGS